MILQSYKILSSPVYYFIHVLSNAFFFFFLDLAPKPISKDDRLEEPVDIMRKLEQAIANGNHKEASLLAKEVTKLQISTKLSLKELTEKKTNNKKVEKIKQDIIFHIIFVQVYSYLIQKRQHLSLAILGPFLVIFLPTT